MRYDSCRQCTKRRIKCDKGTPRCAKCIKKDLECSGIGKTYHFVENTTPETIEASRREARDIEGEAFDDGSSTATYPSLRSTSNDSTGFILNERDDVEGTAVAASGAQQSIDEAIVHLPRQQRAPGADTAQMSKFSLHYPVSLYKPGQVMLMDHCKSISWNSDLRLFLMRQGLNPISSRQSHSTVYDNRPRCRQQRISRPHTTYGASRPASTPRCHGSISPPSRQPTEAAARTSRGGSHRNICSLTSGCHGRKCRKCSERVNMGHPPHLTSWRDSHGIIGLRSSVQHAALPDGITKWQPCGLSRPVNFSRLPKETVCDPTSVN